MSDIDHGTYDCRECGLTTDADLFRHPASFIEPGALRQWCPCALAGPRSSGWMRCGVRHEVPRLPLRRARADYHADRKSLSVSGAKVLLKAPALFRWQHDNPGPQGRL